MKQHTEMMRKKPQRRHAGETVETILEASAQILQHESDRQFNTNNIARRSGFSVGALYQYFPNKDAILWALAHRERQKIAARVTQALETSKDLPLEDAVREIVKICLGAFDRRFGARRALLRMVLRSGNIKIFSESLSEVANAIALEMVRMRRPDLRSPTEASIYVMSRALLGTIRSALLEESQLLGRKEFEDELVILLCRYLRKE